MSNQRKSHNIFERLSRGTEHKQTEKDALVACSLRIESSQSRVFSRRCAQLAIAKPFSNLSIEMYFSRSPETILQPPSGLPYALPDCLVSASLGRRPSARVNEDAAP